MAPLEAQYPLINSIFRHFCASHGIFSVEDFLVHDVESLVDFADRSPDSVMLKQGITQLISLLDGWHQPWLNGLTLLEDAEQHKQSLPTGCERIDAFLRGGLREGHLTELVGPSSSGKTQVCMRAASHVAMKYGTVVFFDTGNSFSPKRISQIVDPISDPDREATKTLQKVMSNIICYSAFDVYTLLSLLHQLKLSMKSQTSSQVRLLIVDSISSLIAPVLGGSSAEGHALMVSVGFLLKELADKHNVAVVVTNHMVGGEGGDPKPALGESWKSIPHVRLQLSRDHARNIFTMSIITHPYMASGKTVSFTIL